MTNFTRFVFCFCFCFVLFCFCFFFPRRNPNWELGGDLLAILKTQAII